MGARDYDDQQRIEIVRELEAGMTNKDAAEKYGVSAATLSSWRTKYGTGASAAQTGIDGATKMQHVIAYSGLSDSKADTYLSEHDITASQVNEWRTQAENALDGKFAGDSDDPIRDIRALLNQVQKEQTQTQKFIDDIANMASRSR